jgi:hypothetical protein
MSRLAAVDAQTYWMSAKIPNDQFLLYAFAGTPALDGPLLDGLLRRAGGCPDLSLRLVDDNPLRYPRWAPAVPGAAQIAVHDGERDWGGCLDAVAALAARQVDPRRAAWRLHLFGPVTGAPTGHDAVTVAVLQISHALADGTRTAQLAGWLFGRDQSVPALPNRRRGSLLLRSITAARTHRRLTADLEAGRIPPPPPPRPVLPTNTAPAGPQRLRTLIRPRAVVAQGGTVTVGALVAIGAALAEHLSRRGVDPATLGAEVPMAIPGERVARNHFRNVGVGLYPNLSPADRAPAIVEDFRAATLRSEHPATLAAGAAFAATPAALLRWGVAQFDTSVRAPLVTGNTVVSSVNRGPADLHLGDSGVVLTAGYPALSPMMGLTHGVHGIGDAIAVSVHAADSAMTAEQLADYVDALERSLSSSP